MVDPQEVVLEIATAEDAGVLSNLMELYVHDLSEVFDIELGPDGRFGYEKLPLYWSEPGHRFPFLFRYRGRPAGFALVTRGSPASDDQEAFDVAEFFVVRRYRRSGLGRHSAFLLWNRFPVRWIVRVSEGNQGGCDFWGGVIAEYTNGALEQTLRPGNPHAWRVFSFNSRSRSTPV